MKAILLLFLSAVTALAQSQFDLKSPDGKVLLQLRSSPSNLVYEISRNGKTVIEPSRFSISLDGKPLTGALKFEAASGATQTYPTRGVHTIATNRWNGRTLSCDSFSLELRAFNDGVAFRYKIPAATQPRTPDESTQFTLPAESLVWRHGLGGHYEDVYKMSLVEQFAPGEWAAPPMTIQLPRGQGYAVITEAALANFSGMALQYETNRAFTLALGHKHPISYPFRLRYSNDIDRVSMPASIVGEIVSPWRVIIISSDLNGLVNSDLISNLSPPPDPKLFPDGLNTSWIKPGRAVWKYLDGGANTFDDMKRFSAWAGELGFEYNILEGFWSRWTNEQLKELADYSRRRGVGLWLWRHSKELRTPEAREEFFARLEKVGAVGAKIDFFDHEHKEIIDLYQALLEGAAKHHLMVNFHGANKPAGESRTFPNELNREAVRGMEASRLKERAAHNTTLPFTRFIAGPADYTPVHFGARRGDTTATHQIATAVVFTEPLLTYGAHPTNLLNSPALPLLKTIPATWDETRVLAPSSIGNLALYARRSGTTWYLAVLNGPTARKISIPLDFLPKKKLTITELREDSKLTEKKRKPARSLNLDLPAGGGYLARFSEK